MRPLPACSQMGSVPAREPSRPGAGLRSATRAVAGIRIETLAFVAIVVAACLVAVVWAVRVPAFQEPDEIAHADAAFAFFDAGGYFVRKRAEPANFVTPQARYLMAVGDYRRVRYDAHASVPSGYGTPAFERRADARAPKPLGAPPRDGAAMPYALFLYSPVYYLLVSDAMEAGWMESNHSLFAAFTAGRLLNVVMLGLTLAAGYGILRELRLTFAQRLLLLCGTAFLPLSSWMGGYIQPDNQSALLLTAALYAAMRARRQPASVGWLALLVVAESMLALTKAQYAAVALAGLVPYLARPGRGFSWPRLAATVLLAGVLPLVVIVEAHRLSPVGVLAVPTAGSGYASLDASGRVELGLTEATRAAVDAFAGGQAFRGFWMHFGMRRDTIFPAPASGAFVALLVAATFVTLLACGVAAVRTLRRIALVARRRGLASAAAFLGADPFFTMCVTLDVVLFGLYAFSDGFLELQGRYWYPVLLPIAVVSVRAIASAVSRRHARRAATVACLLWAAYGLVATPCALGAMQASFYARTQTLPTFEIGDVEAIDVAGRRVPHVDDLRVRRGETIALHGSVLDTSRGYAASDVRVRVDGGAPLRARTGLPDPHLAKTFNDPLLANGGFSAIVSTSSLRPGLHRLEITAFERRAPAGLPVQSLTFVVTNAAER